MFFCWQKALYEKTPQTEAMKKFLKKECVLNKQNSVFTRLLEAQDIHSEPSDEEIADWTNLNLIDVIIDTGNHSADQIKQSMDMLEAAGYTVEKRTCRDSLIYSPI